jgi:diguanylate cyclase (GGDEF)-like protein
MNGEILESNNLFLKAVHQPDSLVGNSVFNYIKIDEAIWNDVINTLSTKSLTLCFMPDYNKYQCHLIPFKNYIIVMGHYIEHDLPHTLSVMADEMSRVANLTRELSKKNKQLVEAKKKIEEMMKVDPLTGLYNRNELNVTIREYIQSSRRYFYPLSLVICDLDHFKTINDTYGHDMGDIVLVGFADVLKKSCRSTDYTVRYGGEEFLVLLPHTTMDQAVTVADKIRKGLKSCHLVDDKVITASFGVTELVKDINEVQFIKNADIALYRAKNSGRDKIVSFKKSV